MLLFVLNNRPIISLLSCAVEEQQKEKVVSGPASPPTEVLKTLSSAASDTYQLSHADIPATVKEASSVEATAEAFVVPFVPITLVCRDICYYVDDPSSGTAPGVVKDTGDKDIAGKLQLLKNIDLYAEPGQLVALMGGSGAGKTTLMDVVAGRKTQGLIRGDILVNGSPSPKILGVV